MAGSRPSGVAAALGLAGMAGGDRAGADKHLARLRKRRRAAAYSCCSNVRSSGMVAADDERGAVVAAPPKQPPPPRIMSHLSRLTPLVPFLIAGCSGTDFADVTDVSVTAQNSAVAFPDVIPLPVGFSPEGVVVGAGPDFYVGSLADGSIFKGNLISGEGGILVPGQAGSLAVGLAFDPRSDYLYVAGGLDGSARVYDAGSGALVGSFAAPGAGFINDVIVTRTAAYFTDSFTPTLYRLALGAGGTVPDPGALDAIPLGGDFTSIPGAFNANGVEATADGASLLVVNGSTGELYRVDPLTGNALEIDLGGGAVPSGDGLVLEGQTLYVVQNFLNQIAEIRLAPDLASGVIERVITSPLFRIPTTADRFGNALYAVNARFDVATPGVPNALDFEVVRVGQ